jgi:hypothetical protein
VPWRRFDRLVKIENLIASAHRVAPLATRARQNFRPAARASLTGSRKRNHSQDFTNQLAKEQHRPLRAARTHHRKAASLAVLCGAKGHLTNWNFSVK